MKVLVRISGTDCYDLVPMTDDCELADAPYYVFGQLTAEELENENLVAEITDTIKFWASECITCGEETLSNGMVLVGGVE